MSFNSFFNRLFHLGIIFLFFTFSACSSSDDLKLGKRKNIEINNELKSDTSVSNIIAPYKGDLDKKMNEVLNTTQVDLLLGRPESNMGNWVTDLSFEIGNSLYSPEDNKMIDFCLLNHGGLRTSIAKGPITLGKVFEVMPFENELVIITLSAEKVLELFDYIAKANGEPLSNASVIIKEDKVSSIKIDGAAFDSTRSYKVITSDYLARGGDKMTFFIDPINYEKAGIKLRDAIILYLKQEAEAGRTITSTIEGRISYE